MPYVLNKSISLAYYVYYDCLFQQTVPYLALIPGALYHGSMVRIKGTMHHGADR